MNFNFSFRYLKAGVSIISSLLLLVSCVSTMSVDEAKRVTVSTNKKSFAPPPRRISDITAVLDQNAPDTETIQKLIQLAGEDPPKNALPATMVNFYYERGMAAMKIGKLHQSLTDFRHGMALIEDHPIKSPMIREMIFNLASAERQLNNVKTAVECVERARKRFPDWTPMNLHLTWFYSKYGDIQRAEEARKRGALIWDRWGDDSPDRIHHDAMTKAWILNAQGKYADAEPLHRKAIHYARTTKVGKTPRLLRADLSAYAMNLMHQDRLVEAEIAAREALLMSLDMFGKQSFNSAAHGRNLAKVLMKQGRHRDAQTLLETMIQKMEFAGIPADSLLIGELRFSLGETLMEQESWSKALVHFRMAEKAIKKYPSAEKKYFLEKTSMNLVLLKTGNAGEALNRLRSAYELALENWGNHHGRTAKILSLYAAALAGTGRDIEAYERFSSSVPIVLGKKADSTQVIKLILERYLALLARVEGTPIETRLGIDAVAEAFRIADSARSRIVGYALNQSLIRNTMTNPELADFARREQDAQKEIGSLETLLSDHLSAVPEEQAPLIIADLREKISNLREAKKILRHEIKKGFPTYTAMLNPPPMTIGKVQTLLHPDEVMVSIYPDTEKTYIWAIPSSGKPQFVVSPMGKKSLQNRVVSLRKTLAPDPRLLGDIPEFDLKKAHDLYLKLLKPVEPSWKHARDLILVVSGPLGQLPFSVLPTEPVQLKEDTDILFADYRDIPWLIRRVSTTRLPAVSSFVSLRTVQRKGADNRKVFAGFGDPLFNLEQLALKKDDKKPESTKIASRGVRLRIRGLRVTKLGNLDKEELLSNTLDDLVRLPDTAEEIQSIGQAMGADIKIDIFLGKNASEKQVKTMDLSDRKVIAFASHALIPGDLDGLTQPAIALSAPSVTGGKEDGLLTMEEIMDLKLNADWVVLSACNTGAADGAGAEAVSGLGRAFFYAGTRAILVSMWPVETTSAKRLTTGIFDYQNRDKSLSRARALQKSMLDLIDNQHFKDKSANKNVASYAHPFFWAPFILVGDGG
jgi:CHAT domain-containing protein